jgi:hypothetical protein
MTILFDARHRVKSGKRFGAGILPSVPSFKAPFRLEDAAWWASQPTPEDRHYDQLEAEAISLARLDMGLCM